MAPLSSLRVLEFGTMIAAPQAAQILASYGASVIKVEDTLTGDQLRLYGSMKGNTSGWFLNVNAGKRSIALNLKDAAGVRIAKALTREADVLIEGYRDGVMERLGLGYEALRAINPALVYCSSSGFGAEGPYAGRPAYDPLIQALAGWAGSQQAQGHPSLVRGMVADKIAAANNAEAVLAALVQRAATGVGCHIRTNMLDANIAFLWGDVMMHETLQDEDALHRPNLMESYRLFKAADGWVSVAIGNDRQWREACSVLEQPQIAALEAFATAAERAQRIGDWYELIDRLVAPFSAADVVQRLVAADVPAAIVQAPERVFEDAHVRATTLVQESMHPQAGRYRHPRPRTAQFDGQPEPLCPAPAWGQQGTSILRELGLSEAEITELKEAGTVRLPQEL